MSWTWSLPIGMGGMRSGGELPAEFFELGVGPFLYTISTH